MKRNVRKRHHGVTEQTDEEAMFKITATIIKPGGAPVAWVHYSAHQLERTECEKMFFRHKKAGNSFGEKVSVENFFCEKMAQRDV